VTTLADRFRRHAAALDDDAPLYGVLLRGMADDWEARGAIRDICVGWEAAPPGAVVQLRLLAGLHRMVLTGRAPQLAPYYRSVRGTAAPNGAWTVARPVAGAHRAELRAALDLVPQTNEVGRAAALVVALFDAAHRTGLRRIRLLEVGASAGLNLLVDRFRVTGPGWQWGPADSPVVLDGFVTGPVQPGPVEIVERRGCDLEPIDPTSSEGRLRLRSFVWPDQVDRNERLAGALDIAARVPAVVDHASAASWLRERLAEQTTPDVLTVVWHSVVWQYLPGRERQEAEAAIAAAGRHVVHVAMEPPLDHPTQRPRVSVTTWPDGVPERRVIADAGFHGTPVRVRP
jgi:hypothetical protein